MVVLYTGAMGLSNEIPDLVEAVRAMAGDERIVWWFAGSGPEAEKLQKVSHRGTERTEDGGGSSLVHYCESSFVGVKGDPIGNRQSATGNYASIGNRFLGKLSKEQVLELYLAADVNVVTFMHAPLFYENSPNKFFDGIAAGLPTIFNRSTWLEPWLNEYGCGIVCTSDPAGTEMAQQLKRLAADGALRTAMGAGARRLAKEVFGRDKLAGEYLAVLKRVVPSPR